MRPVQAATASEPTRFVASNFTTDHKHCECQDIPRLLPRPRARPCSCWLPICRRQASRPVHRPQLKPGRLRRYHSIEQHIAPHQTAMRLSRTLKNQRLVGGVQRLAAHVEQQDADGRPPQRGFQKAERYPCKKQQVEGCRAGPLTSTLVSTSAGSAGKDPCGTEHSKRADSRMR